MRQILALAAVTLALGLIGLAGGKQAAATHIGTIVLVGDSTPGDDGAFPYACGDPLNPCDTIQHGVDHATSGIDTVQVAAGTYTENITLAKSLRLRGAQAGVDACGRMAIGGESTVTGSGLLLELRTGSAGSTIDGFEFSGGTRAIESTSGPINDLQTLNNRIGGFTGNGVFLNDSGTNITANQNEVDGTSKTGSGALFHLDTDNFDGFHFTNNCVINGDTATGFFVDGNHNIDASTAGSRTPQFSGNLIDNNNTGANLGSRAWSTGPIRGNTFSNNNFDGLQGGMQNSQITENVFDGNGRHGLALTSFGNTAADRGAQNNDILMNCFARNGFTNTGAAISFSAGQAAGTIATNEAHNNNIQANRLGALYTGTETIDATLNWWGAVDGPGPPDGTGSGDGVDGQSGGGMITFTPFLVAPAVAPQCGPPPVCEAKITNGGWIIADNGDKASFGGVARSDEDGNVTGQEEYQDHGPAEPQNVKSIQVLTLTCNDDRTQATIAGTATIDGTGMHMFTIDVQDLGEPGKGSDTYRIRLDTGYDSGEHVLKGGNVQIH